MVKGMYTVRVFRHGNRAEISQTTRSTEIRVKPPYREHRGSRFLRVDEKFILKDQTRKGPSEMFFEMLPLSPN